MRSRIGLDTVTAEQKSEPTPVLTDISLLIIRLISYCGYTKSTRFPIVKLIPEEKENYPNFSQGNFVHTSSFGTIQWYSSHNKCNGYMGITRFSKPCL